jgi:hypothetical protein
VTAWTRTAEVFDAMASFGERVLEPADRIGPAGGSLTLAG